MTAMLSDSRQGYSPWDATNKIWAMLSHLVYCERAGETDCDTSALSAEALPGIEPTRR
jgi:hypothetical protein